MKQCCSFQIEWRCGTKADRLQVLVDGVEAPVKVGKENNGYQDRQIKRITSTVHRESHYYCPFRCRVYGPEGLCCALYSTGSLCSCVCWRSSCDGVASCWPQSAGSCGGGSSDILQSHCGSLGSVELQPLWRFPHVWWSNHPLIRPQPSLWGETAQFWPLVWVDLKTFWLTLVYMKVYQTIMKH